MRKEIVEKKVSKVMQENPQISPVFLPVITEFFLRLEDQFDFNEQQIDEKIKSLGDLLYMKFWYLEEFNSGANAWSYDVGDDNYTITKLKNRLRFNLDFLKEILKGNNEVVTNYIETCFHELGHCMQYRIKDNSIFTGFEKNSHINGQIYRRGCLTNEYTEVVNSKLLMNGDANSESNSYRDVMNIGKAFFVSLGFSDKEIATLQWEKEARERFESIVKERVGADYKQYLVATEDRMDTILNIYSKLIDKNTKEDEVLLKKNLEIQMRGFNMLTNCILQKRILNSNKDLKTIAKIDWDKNNRDSLICDTISNNFKKCLAKKEIDINEAYNKKIIEQEVGIDNLEKYLNIKDQITDEQEFPMFDEEKKYNNDKLIQEIVKTLQNIDIKQFPLFQRIDLFNCKVIGKINNLKKNFFNTRNKRLSEKPDSIRNNEKEIINSIDKMKKFKEKLSVEEMLNYNKIVNNKNKTLIKGKEEDENVR